MNKTILMGRLTKDPELTSTSNGISRCSFTVAVDRRFKNADGEREADFIPVVAWRSTAEFVSRYFSKGQRIALVGSIQVRSWDDQQSGQRRYITEVVADEVYFADSKSSNQSSDNYNYSNNNNNSYSGNNFSNNSYTNSSDGFFEAPDDDTELPFDL